MYMKRPYQFILFYLLISSIFYFNTHVKTETSHVKRFTESTFVWTSTYTINGQYLKGFAKTSEGDKWYIDYKFSSDSEKQYFLMQSLAGSAFHFSGKTSSPRLPAHEYAFDMSSYLKSHSAVGVFSVSSWKQLSRSKGIVGFLANQRYQVEKHIEQTFPKSLVAEAKALIIGLRDDVSYEEERAYQKLGITHLFAISGLHVAFLTFLLYQTFIRLHVRKQSIVMMLLILLPIYAIMTGGAPSVWRAVSVSEIVLLFTLVRKRIDVETAFSVSILLFIFVQPSVIFQVGFQLSYGAAATLVFSSRILAKNQSPLRLSFLITFLCQVGVFPILLFHFYEVSISSFITNLFFVPLFSFIILPINLLFLFLTACVPSVSSLFFSLYEPLREMLRHLILFISSMPYQLWNPGKPSIPLLIIGFIGVISTFVILERNRSLKNLVYTLGVPIFLIQITPYFDSSLEVSFINVGQGDAILIEYPYKQGVVLIDAGGLLRFNQAEWKRNSNPFEIGRNIVIPYLKGKGIAYIDTFIWTHSDSDHIEGAEEVIEVIRIGEIHVTPGAIEDSTLQQAIKEAKLHGIPIREQMIGHKWSVGKTHMEYLSPTDTVYVGNNDSLVLLLKHEEFKAVFTGDLEESGEKEILQTYKEALSPISLLKAGHHGSHTSSSQKFIDTLRPVLTIFSAGEDNRYGHPHKDVVQRFKDLQLKTLSTAESGTIRVRFKDQVMTIQ